MKVVILLGLVALSGVSAFIPSNDIINPVGQTTCIQVKCDKNRDSVNADWPNRAVVEVTLAAPNKMVEVAWSRNRGTDTWQSSNACIKTSGLANVVSARKTMKPNHADGEVSKGGGGPGKSGTRLMRQRADADGYVKFSHFVEDCDTFFWQALMKPGKADCALSAAVAANEGAAMCGGSAGGSRNAQCIGSNPHLRYLFLPKFNKLCGIQEIDGGVEMDDTAYSSGEPQHQQNKEFWETYCGISRRLAPEDGGPAVGGGVVFNNVNMPDSSSNMAAWDSHIFLHADETVTWIEGDFGESDHGDENVTYASARDEGNIKAVFTTEDDSVLAIRNDGTVLMWGDSAIKSSGNNFNTNARDMDNYLRNTTGMGIQELLEAQEIKKVVHTEMAFLAMMADGSFVYWGSGAEWDEVPNYNGESILKACVKDVICHYDSCAVVTCDGHFACMGDCKMSMVPVDFINGTVPGGGIVHVHGAGDTDGFMIETEDGGLYVVGDKDYYYNNSTDILSAGGIKKIYMMDRYTGGSDHGALVVILMDNGSVEIVADKKRTWTNFQQKKADYLDGHTIKKIEVSEDSAVILRDDGVLVWFGDCGDEAESLTNSSASCDENYFYDPWHHCDTRDYCAGDIVTKNTIVDVWNSENAYVVETEDGRIYSWGQESKGGYMWNETATWLHEKGATHARGGTNYVACGDEGCVAVFNDGTYAAWSSSEYIYFNSYNNGPAKRMVDEDIALHGSKVYCAVPHDYGHILGVMPAEHWTGPLVLQE